MKRYSTIQVLWKDIDVSSLRRERETNSAQALQIYVYCSTIKIPNKDILPHLTIFEWNVEQYINSSKFLNMIPHSAIFFQFNTFFNIAQKKSRIMFVKHCRKMECGRLYQFFHIQQIFFRIDMGCGRIY